jgi:hypothetical protein
MPPPTLRDRIETALRAELNRLDREALDFVLCLSDASWRRAMAAAGCPAYTARLASPTARRGTRGKLGMATICHLRHGHAAVVYVKTRGRTWGEIEETVRHEALHLGRPSYSHRQVEAALGHPVPPIRRRRRGR